MEVFIAVAKMGSLLYGEIYDRVECGLPNPGFLHSRIESALLGKGKGLNFKEKGNTKTLYTLTSH